jgi:hypothetical protein
VTEESGLISREDERICILHNVHTALCGPWNLIFNMWSYREADYSHLVSRIRM